MAMAFSSSDMHPIWRCRGEWTRAAVVLLVLHLEGRAAHGSVVPLGTGYRSRACPAALKRRAMFGLSLRDKIQGTARRGLKRGLFSLKDSRLDGRMKGIGRQLLTKVMF